MIKDNDIIKALECCHQYGFGNCPECPVYEDGGCVRELMKRALDLINRQKAEIERLEKEVVDRDKIIDERGNEVIRHDNAIRSLYKQLETIRAKAIKEVVERFYDECLECPLEDGDLTILVDRRTFDNLVKEMTEGV